MGKVSGTCLICHQQKSDEIVKVGKGGTWARAQTSGPLHWTLKGLHTTALWSGFWLCLLNTVWLFLGWTEVFPFWNSTIFIIAEKIIWFFVPNLGNYYLLLKWQGIPPLLKSFAKPCHLLRNSRKERNNKRILKFKSAKLVGILELSWPRVLTLTFMTRSNESRTRWPCVHELVGGRPMYLWILFPILGSTLLHVDMVKYCKDSCNTPNCINGYKQPFLNIVLDRLYTI